MGKSRRSRRGSVSDDDSAEEERRKRRKGVKGREMSSEDEASSDDEEREKRRKKGSRRQGSDEERARKRKTSRDKVSRSSEEDEESDDEERSRRRKRERRRRRSKRSEDESDSDSESDSEDGRGRGGSRGGLVEAAKKVSEEELREFLAKRAKKKAQKVAKKLRQRSVSGYTNDSNPFGDSNLTETFVWGKKIEREVLTGVLDPREVTLKKEKERLQSRMEEIEKVKKRRDERLLEKARHEEEMAMLARERARAEFQDWEEKEDQFHFEQSKVRAEIRLKEGRAKPIDVLARNLSLSEDFDVEINEPYKIFRGLTVKEMEDLREDIKLHMEYDRNNPLNVEFWTSLMVVCNHEIAATTRRDILDRAKVRGEEPPPEVVGQERGLHLAVDAEVDATLAVKSSAELDEMQARVVGQMEKGEAKIVEYWESVLKRLKVFRAKARLREIHTELLRRHLAVLQAGEGDPREGVEGFGRERQQQGKEEAGRSWEQEDEDEGGHGGQGEGQPGSFSPELLTEEQAAEEGVPIVDEPAGGAGTQAGGEAGSFSPELMESYEGEDVEDPDKDVADLEEKRASIREKQQQQQQQKQKQQQEQGREDSADGVLGVGGRGEAAGRGSGLGGTGTGTDLTAAERAQALKMMGPAEGDAILGTGAEVSLESQVYWWHDKYRPRKPKYFNRVHTGYEWNKYNQTHYDHDNPPPKIVQGYKFNIFYPDLIDRTRAPHYSVEKDGSNGETCLIRFHAGPPYEDIAFRIVNKEWEYSHKKGFKCTFDRGILHVYFNFKRYRYRR